MKRIKSTLLYGGLLIASAMFSTSCSDWLELAPIDNYGSGSYWKTEAQVAGYIDGIHKHLRDAAWQHTMVFGEFRGGTITGTSSADGNTMSNGAIRFQNFDKNNTGVSKFGDLYGRIANLNLFISRVTDATYLSETKKNYYLGQIYGLRAFYYFDLYRIYGGVPLRLTVDVIDGELDPNKLYMERSTPKQVMALIKSDLTKSMEYFGDVNDFDPYKNQGKKVYWSKAATECLMGEVYLWTSKVTTGDDVANVADLTTAKQHLLNVLSSYSLKILPNFADVFEAKSHKANDEIIFAVRYLEGEATNNNSMFTYSVTTGQTSKSSLRKDGTEWGDPLQSDGSQWYEYDKALYNMFDEKDVRKDVTFMASYRRNTDGNLVLYGTHVCKNIGYINAQGSRVYCGDYVFYRLAWVYLTLAEIANMEGDNANVEKYINLVRERAYPYYKDGNKTEWEKETYGYTASDFTANELAILKEKTKEFVQEGQRWWDLRRMTLTKGGDPLVFCKEAVLDGENPVLNKEKEAYKVLWPIEQTMIDKDPALKQTPGYEEAEKKN